MGPYFGGRTMLSAFARQRKVILHYYPTRKCFLPFCSDYLFYSFMFLKVHASNVLSIGLKVIVS